jgi:hypothetical protein
MQRNDITKNMSQNSTRWKLAAESRPHNVSTEWQPSKQAGSESNKANRELDGCFVVARACTVQVIFLVAVDLIFSYRNTEHEHNPSKPHMLAVMEHPHSMLCPEQDWKARRYTYFQSKGITIVCHLAPCLPRK